MAFLVLAGITTSNAQQNMYAMASSIHHHKRHTAKIIKHKLSKRHYRFKKKPHKYLKRHHSHIKHMEKNPSHLSKWEQRAKNWISWHESRDRWNISNGVCYGRYQLSYSYLHGDYSHANQSKSADHYVHQRYGTWQKAKRFWKLHYWY